MSNPVLQTAIMRIPTIKLNQLDDPTPPPPQPRYQCPTPNAQRPTPNAQRPTPNTQYPMPNAQCLTYYKGLIFWGEAI